MQNDRKQLESQLASFMTDSSQLPFDIPPELLPAEPVLKALDPTISQQGVRKKGERVSSLVDSPPLAESPAESHIHGPEKESPAVEINTVVDNSGQSGGITFNKQKNRFVLMTLRQWSKSRRYLGTFTTMAEAEECRAKYFNRLDDAAADGSFISVMAAIRAELKAEVTILSFTCCASFD